MVGILVSFWDGLFSGAMLVLGSVITWISITQPFHHMSTWNTTIKWHWIAPKCASPWSFSEAQVAFFPLFFHMNQLFLKKKQPTNSLQITHNRTRIQNKNKKMMILWLYIICLFCSASQGCFQRIYFHRVFKSGSASPWHHADGKRPGPK